jgi:hypothetical protein
MSPYWSVEASLCEKSVAGISVLLRYVIFLCLQFGHIFWCSVHYFCDFEHCIVSQDFVNSNYICEA